MEDIHNYFLDIEFQSYLINRPVNEYGVEDTESDPLYKKGFTAEITRTFVNLPVNGVMKSFNQYVYQFILSIGILIITPGNERSYRFARFPLLINDDEFRTPRILVPNYTFAASGQGELVRAFDSLHLPPFAQLEFGDFPSLDKLTAEQQVIARNMFDIYTASLTAAELQGAKQFLFNLATENNRGKLRVITQGISDINALKNTFIKYNYRAIPNFPHKDITPICKYYKKNVPLENAKLATVKTYIVEETFLGPTEATITSEISSFMTGKYGDSLGGLVAHNPLIDSMYVYLVLAGYRRKEVADPLVEEIKTKRAKGGLRRPRKSTRRVSKKRRLTRRR